MNLTVCYLCGEEITEDQESNKDHIPPKQLFRALKDEEKRNLMTLTVHKQCNEHYQEDEQKYGEYMRLLATNIARYNENAEDIFRKNFRDGQNHPGNYNFTQETVAEGPIYQTENERVTRVYYKDRILTPEESTSINRIVWKIVRGLYYIKNDKVLEKEIEHQIIPTRMPMILARENGSITGAIAKFEYVQDELNQFYQAQADLESEIGKINTQHPKAFNYRYKKLADRNEEIWELQYCEDILKIVRYRL